MSDAISAAQAAFSRDLQHLTVISHNIANVNTPGYQSRFSFDQSAGLHISAQQAVSNEMGGLRETQRPLDVAIVGNGYFLLERNGQVFISRDGRFHVNPQGYLTHVSGALALTTKGPIRFDGINIQVHSDGQVAMDGISQGKLQIVGATNVQLADSGLLMTNHFKELNLIQLKTGALNTSTVNPTTETVRMMELSRHLQSTQKAIAAYDQLLQTGINETGKR
jgi:flagellar basal body rod protein FlgG